MAGYVCSIAGAKGGVGKTTTAVNLGIELAADGHDVVVVDGDLQMPNLGRALDVEADRGIHAALSEAESVDVPVVRSQEGPRVVPGDDAVDAYADIEPTRIEAVVAQLRDEFDVVLVDTGTDVSDETVTVFGISDGVLCLSTPSACSVIDVKKTIDLVDRAGGTVIGNVITRVNDAAEINSVVGEFDVALLGIVPADREATSGGPVVLTDPESTVAEAYGALADSLERVVFDGATSDDLGMAYVEGWFDGEVDDARFDTAEDQGGSFDMFG